MKKSQLNAIAYARSESNAKARIEKVRAQGLESKFNLYWKETHQSRNNALANFCRRERIK